MKSQVVGDRPPHEASLESVASKSRSPELPPVHAMPVLAALSQAEVTVLGAFGQDHRLTAQQFMGRTGLAAEELHATLCGLQARGLLACLNTVIVSYCLRFPGVLPLQSTESSSVGTVSGPGESVTGHSHSACGGRAE